MEKQQEGKLTATISYDGTENNDACGTIDNMGKDIPIEAAVGARPKAGAHPMPAYILWKADAATKGCCPALWGGACLCSPSNSTAQLLDCGEL